MACLDEKNVSFVIVDDLDQYFLLSKVILVFMICLIEKNKQEIFADFGGTLGLHRRNPFGGSARSVGSDSGLPRKCTGGTHVRDPPVPPDLENETVRIFNAQDDFRIFRKLLKTKT